MWSEMKTTTSAAAVTHEKVFQQKQKNINTAKGCKGTERHWMSKIFFCIFAGACLEIFFFEF